MFLTEICSHFQALIIASQAQFAKGSSKVIVWFTFSPFLRIFTQGNLLGWRFCPLQGITCGTLTHALFTLWALTAKFGALNRALRLHIQSRSRSTCLVEAIHKSSELQSWQKSNEFTLNPSLCQGGRTLCLDCQIKWSHHHLILGRLTQVGKMRVPSSSCSL